MKKLMTFVFALILVLGLAACSAQEKQEEIKYDLIPQNNAASQETAALKEPPALTVAYGEESIEALRGTSSWTYQNEDGTWTGIEADSMHPLQAKEYMPSLTLLPVTTSSRSPLSAAMQWDTIPDEVSVRCWSEAYWGQYDAESEEIPAKLLCIDSSDGCDPYFSVELKDGSYVYEVIAEWNSAETYHGNACYSFYTVKSNIQ